MGGTTRWQPTRDQGGEAEHDRGANPRDEIRRRHFGPLIPDQADNAVGRERAGGETQREQRCALSRNELDDLARCCPECAANAELAFASRDLQREQTVQTDGGENKTKSAEGGDENEDEALG